MFIPIILRSCSEDKHGKINQIIYYLKTFHAELTSFINKFIKSEINAV